MTSLIAVLLEQPAIYRLWQRPFAQEKLAPFRRHNNLARLGRVLDVGCGPGTNARHLASTDYLGLDINPKYIAYARQRYPGRFEVADAARFSLGEDQQFDCIIVNSLLHHLDDAAVCSLLSGLRSHVSPDGSVHVLELVKATGLGFDTLLTRADRGRFSRSLERWSELVRQFYDVVVVEPYPLGVGRVVLWNMVYMKGRPR
jgi:SAM-dependent methyltransferase